jgi:AP-1 complex subunit gamma-1
MEIMSTFGSHLNIDLQQRGIEFTQLFGPFKHLREPLLEKMPCITINRMNGNATNGNEESDLIENQHNQSEIIVKTQSSNNTDTLLDLLGSGDDILSPVNEPIINSNTIPQQSNNLLDLLGDIDDVPPMTTIAPQHDNNNFSSIPNTLSIFDDNDNTKIPTSIDTDMNNFNLNMLNNALSPKSKDTKTITAMNKNDVLVQFITSKVDDYTHIIVTTTNNSIDTLEQYLFQVKSFLKF